MYSSQFVESYQMVGSSPTQKCREYNYYPEVQRSKELNVGDGDGDGDALAQFRINFVDIHMPE